MLCEPVGAACCKVFKSSAVQRTSWSPRMNSTGSFIWRSAASPDQSAHWKPRRSATSANACRIVSGDGAGRIPSACFVNAASI